VIGDWTLTINALGEKLRTTGDIGTETERQGQAERWEEQR